MKSALVQTGTPVADPADARPVREGGGLVDLQKADAPLVFASPTNLSFGLLPRGASVTRTITLEDAGGGAAPWTVTVEQLRADSTRVDRRPAQRDGSRPAAGHASPRRDRRASAS